MARRPNAWVGRPSASVGTAMTASEIVFESSGTGRVRQHSPRSGSSVGMRFTGTDASTPDDGSGAATPADGLGGGRTVSGGSRPGVRPTRSRRTSTASRRRGGRPAVRVPAARQAGRVRGRLRRRRPGPPGFVPQGPAAAAGAAGPTVTEVDEADRPVAGATAWFGEQGCRCDTDGRGRRPFTTPGRRPAGGGYARPDAFDHQAEADRPAAGVHVGRGSRPARQSAAPVVRPQPSTDGRRRSRLWKTWRRGWRP